MANQNSTGFFSLPAELRNTIYELVLVRDESVSPYHKYNPNHAYGETFGGLLRVNHAIYHEAKSILYAQNHFDLTMFAEGADLAAWFSQIGDENAAQIQHVIIAFPGFAWLQMGEVAIRQSSMDMFAAIREFCTNLATITTDICGTDTAELKLYGSGSCYISNVVLSLVNSCFESLPSLPEVIVEVFVHSDNDGLMTKMMGHGWTIVMIENIEEEVWEDHFFHDYDNDNYDSDGYNPIGNL